MKWYKAKLYSPFIEEVEVLRETESCVFIKDGLKGERKCIKNGSCDSYFNNKSSAIEFIVNHYSKQIIKAKENVEHRKKEYKRVLESLKNFIG